MAPPSRDPFTALGLTRIVNVSGTETRWGAAPVCPEVLTAVAALAPSTVDMHELQSAASRAIVGAFGTEAGMVAHCTAAGVCLAVAGCMTGLDAARIHQLPDTRGMKHEVVLQRGHSIDYGAPLGQTLRVTGATVLEIGSERACSADDLAAALTERTAAAVYVVSHHTASTGMLALADFVRLCRARGVPVIVDAAAEPHVLELLAAEPDLVIVSAHKRYAGLTSAIVAGRAERVRAALAQESGIGRPMKAGKEAVAGVIAALERWHGLDHAAAARELEARLSRTAARLRGLPGVAVSVAPDAVSNRFSRLHLTLDPVAAGSSAAELAARLAQRSPAIIVRVAALDQLHLDLRLVTDDTALVVADAIVDELG